MLVFVHQCHSALDVVLALSQFAHVLVNDVVDFVSALSVGVSIECKLYLSF